MTRQPMRSILLALWISAISVAATAGEARAEEGEDRVAEARQRYDRGVELDDLGRNEAALAEFLQAYRLAPNFAVLYNIAQINARLGRIPEAFSYYQRYLDEGGELISAVRRAEVEERIAQFRTQVGLLRVSVEPPVAATVYIDGVESGRLPLAEPLMVSSGRRAIELRAAGYLPFRRVVMVAGGTEEPLRCELVPVTRAPGGVLVDVAIPGATVALDDDEVGVTPLNEAIAAPPGAHRVRVTRPGYQPVEVEVEVASGEIARVELELRLRDEIPSEVAGHLDVRVSENGADIRLDGEPLGQGPVPAGPHLLEVELEGFEPWSRQIEAEAGSTTGVEIELRPTPEVRRRFERRARRFRAAAFAMLGLAVASLGTTFALWMWNDGRHEQWGSERASIVTAYGDPGAIDAEHIGDLWGQTETNNEMLASIQAAEIVTWALLGLGLGAGLVSTTLFITGPYRNRYAEISLEPNSRGVSVSARW